ncbi:glycosyltransferase family protein [Hymenobacter rigui]|uniref:Glycosyl transferase n=1 Tax=Hymenobacter rigui TaxID=334424 RepID=A0A3R9MUX2_9BACT|nr:hypothetical protein [Hymenobacter rigui]RSK49055.1 hypothetical protein EI291_10895 [Hymenobacter rigui]
MVYLTLLSYGGPVEYHRALGAALSFYAHYSGPEPVTMALFTDNPEFFRPYLRGVPVEYLLLPPERRLAMVGPDRYSFRVKICILQELMQRWPGADVLYLDSDTLVQRDPAPLLRDLQAGIAFMDQPEHTFAEAVVQYAARPDAAAPGRLIDLFGRQQFLVNGQWRQFTAGQKCWNSGVLGLPAAAAALLPDVLRLCDAFYAGSEWFTSEQLAFSVALPLRFPLRRADAYVYHYWSPAQKAWMDRELARLLPGPAAPPLTTGLTTRWVRRLVVEKLREGALYAARRGRPVPACKYALKAMVRTPFALTFVGRFIQALRLQPAL